MGDIESITSVIQQLSASVTFWNNLRYFCVGATALLTFLSFLTFWVSGIKTDALGKAKDELAEAKNRAQALLIAKVEKDAEVKIETSKETIARVKAEADKKIALLSTEAAQAKKEIAVANEKAESERLARLQLEARLAPRTLTAEQQTQVISLLRSFPGAEVDVVTFGDTSEIGTISMTLLGCLRKAGWNVHSGTAVGGDAVVRGILVGVRSNTDTAISNAARVLISALQSMGIDAGLWDFNKMPYPSPVLNTSLTHNAPMKIFIGSKP